MRAALIGFAVVVLIGGCQPASAATIAGVFTPTESDHNLYASLPMPDPGRYLVSFSLSRPAIGMLEATVIRSWDEYEKGTGHYLGGDDNPIIKTLEFYPTPRANGVFWFNYPPVHFYDYPDSYVIEYFHDGGAYLNATFSGEAPVTWSLTVDRYDLVPEPATWALMIVGFGLAGSALRRRGPRYAL